MSILRFFLFSLSVLPSVVLLDEGMKTSDTYGPYTMTYSNFQLCRGPKRFNSSMNEGRLVDDGNSKILELNTTKLDDSRMQEIRILVYIIKGTSRTTLWDYRWKQPCKYDVMSNLMKQIGVNNCSMPKGFYSFTIRVSDVVESLIGGSFFYGEFLVKAISVSSKGNLFCGVTNILFKKKM